MNQGIKFSPEVKDELERGWAKIIEEGARGNRRSADFTFQAFTGQQVNVIEVSDAATRFIADVRGTGYTIETDDRSVIVTVPGQPDSIPFGADELRKSVSDWLAVKSIRSTIAHVNAIAVEVERQLRAMKS